MKSFISIAILLFVFCSFASANDGVLTQDTIDNLKSSFVMDANTRNIYNSLTGNSINALALDRDLLNSHNDMFSDKIKTKGITNQKRAGTCWLFAGTNMLRAGVLGKHELEKFEFSENYLLFWDKLEKANCFYDRMIRFCDTDLDNRKLQVLLKTPITDGGYWESVTNLIKKYGMAPKGIMPSTHSTEDTKMMNRILERKLCADTIKLRKMHTDGHPVKALHEAKEKMLAEVYRMLVLNLGTPPEKFEWRFEDANSVPSEPVEYTPKSFYEEFVSPNLDEYVDLFNDPTKEYGKHYEIEFSGNVIGGEAMHYINIDAATLRQIAFAAVSDEQPTWFGTDVSKQMYKDKGILAEGIYDYDAIYGVSTAMSKADRLRYRRSIANHAMVFTGVDIKDGKPVKWRVENSWGDEVGKKGMWSMYNTWFDEYVYMVIVNKKYVPAEILEKLKDKPIIIPPWDPMASMVR